MEMYKNPRSESNIIHRLQKLGFRETMGYTDGSSSVMMVSSFTTMDQKVPQRMRMQNLKEKNGTSSFCRQSICR